MSSLRVLHVAAELFPLVKTGGLADVLAALPPAQAELGADVRLLLPGYPAFLEQLKGAKTVVELGPCFGALKARLLLGQLPGQAQPVYLIDAPYLYQRAGGPYQDQQGLPWSDNLQRFALLGWAAAHLAAGDADLQWQPDVVHAHDWHAAMACAYMAEHPPRHAVSIFTIHNMAFQGLFPLVDWHLLGLSSRLASAAGMEFHGQLSFMKAGLQCAHHITTVSPGYAREITTPEFGFGLDGVIRHRVAAVSGILNGIDGKVWNPAIDAALAQTYSAQNLSGKAVCRRALQTELGLDANDGALLLVLVSRLTSQKGVDLLLQALPGLLALGCQLAVQGTGDSALERALMAAHRAHPKRLHVHIGYDEDRAHRLVAGGDVICVPSRFEPCGLTQMYGLRYGTLPLVRHVGGLGDTVWEVDSDTRRANGFVFEAASGAELLAAAQRAVALHAQPKLWRARMTAAMAQDLSWRAPAQAYLHLYQQMLLGPTALRSDGSGSS